MDQWRELMYDREARTVAERRRGGRWGMVAVGLAVVAVVAVWALWSGSPRAAAEAAVVGRPDSLAASAVVPAMPAIPATIRWSPSEVTEGSLFAVFVEGGVPAVQDAAGRFAGQPLHFQRQASGVLVAMAAAPLDSVGARGLSVEIEHIDGSVDSQDLELPVARGTYEMQRLTVAPQFGQPQPPEIQARIDREAARAYEVAERSHETPRLWELPFVAPRESRITSGFGHGRMFNDVVQSRHTGTDFAGAIGATVLAPARGVVALVDSFYLGGNVIYLDHGAGLVTGYLHLSEQLVTQGQTVEAGEVIGRVGATGRVTGPHLHWIVRYGPNSVDGMSLLGFEF